MKENESDSEEEIIIKKDDSKIPTKKMIELQPMKKPSLDEIIKNLKEKEKTKEIHNSYLYNIKDYIFFFGLMISSSINFSYLYLPFIALGIVFIFLIRNNNYGAKKFKFILEIISFIYSVLLSIFKTVCLILVKKDNSYIYNHKDLFLDLGVCYLRDEDSTFYLLMTFMGEVVMILFSLYSIIISHYCREFKPVNDTSLMENKFWTNRNLLMLNYIFILCFAVFNVSFLTLIYMCIIQLIFLVDSLTNNRQKIKNFFKFICLVFMAIILTQVTSINLLNIPKFQEDILHKHEIKEKDNDELFDKVYSIWTKIGINYAYHHDLIRVLREWIGYLSAIFSLLSLTFTLNTIEVNELSKRYKNMDLKTAKTILKQSSVEERNKNKEEKKSEKLAKIKQSFSKLIKYFKKIIKETINFITSPTFIIQFSRVMSIAWMYFYRNFYSLGIFISLFFSFLFINTKSNKYLTIFLLTPMVFISLFCFHLSNINGYFEEYEEEKRIKYLHFGLGKYEYTFLEYFLGNVFYIFIMFLIYSFNNSSPIGHEKSDKIDIINEEDELNESLLHINDSGKTSIQGNNKNIEIVLHKGDTIKKEKKKKNKIKDLSFVNIILKNIFSNIDKITLIVMYFVAVKSINLVHLILVIIFLIQILLPNKIQNLFEIILCLLQFLFFFEIIADLLKVYFIKEYNDHKKFLKFLIKYSDGLSDNNLEIIIYGVVYCFYFQYQIYNFPFLKRIIENKELTLGNYVEVKFEKFENIKKVLFLLGNIILELYIWILIGLFIFVSCYYEISFIFGIKLAWFFVLAYSFLRKIQSPEDGVEFSVFWQGLFLLFCCINTFSVYLYQFISDDYIHLYDNILESKNFFVKNLPNLGFTKYDRDDLYYHFIPHFGLIFIAVLFIKEVRSQLKKLSQDNNRKKTMLKNKEEKIEDEIEEKLKNPLLSEEERELLKAKKFEKNKKLLHSLSLRYFLVNIMRIITKFYWLLLFLTIGLIFTLYDLSFSMTIYMIIFCIIFIRMFHRIITKLTDYISRPSYFISKVIRYSLVEVPRHIQQNKYFRSIAFRFLLSYSFIFYIFMYLYGVFELFQYGCNPKFFKGCEERNDPIFTNGEDTEAYIKAYSYLFGIYINIREEGLMDVAWIHLLLSVLIGFDVYAQKLENKFTDKSEKIKSQMQKLANENSTLYHYTLMSDTNVLIKLGLDLAGINTNKLQEKIRESINKVKESSRHNSEQKSGRQKSIQEQKEEEEINSANADEHLEENIFLKNKRVKLFISIFSKANDNQQTLSDTNNETRLIFFVKKIFEEIIIFLLICIALTKLNILAFIYLIYSAYLTKTRKTMMKFYVLYCFLLALILMQSIIYVSNISDKTCPRDNYQILQILKDKLNIPWYDNHLNLEDKYAFFFGFGVNEIQTALILLEFVQVMVIYIYLDFFSYSIYQDVKNKGETKAAGEKFNFGSIKITPPLKRQIKNMKEKLFLQYRDCLMYNFNLDIGENLEEFVSTKLCLKPDLNEQNNLEQMKDSDKDNTIKTNNEELNKLIVFKTNYYKIREKNRREGTDNIPESPFVKSFQEIVYLYMHCFILILVLAISLMITGMISIFYIVICFYFLINADKIYSGKIYGYPVAIKKLLKIFVIGDIVLQIIYQIPYLSPDQDSVFQKIFEVLGLIKLVDYESGDDGKEIKLIRSGIVEVIGKPLIYFFLSLQIIIYNSKDFKKYYLTFLLNQKNEFNKNSLINTFRFNNERIEAFKNSMNLRLKSEKAMDKLRLILEDWNKKLKLEGSLFEEPKKRPLEFIHEKEEEEKEKEEKNKQEEEEEKEEEEKEEEKKEEEKKEEEKEEEEKEEEDSNKINTKVNSLNDQNNILKSIGEKGALGMFEALKKANRKIIEPEKIKEKITEILLSGFITKFYLWFNRNAIYYKTMPERIKRNYEKNCILGNLDIKCYLENELEKQLKILDLSDFDDKEVEIVEDFFIKYKKGTIEKELEKHKKEILKIKLEELKKQLKQKQDEKEDGMKENIEDENIIDNNVFHVDEKNLNNIEVEYTIKKGDTEININTLKFMQFTYLLETKLFRIYLHTPYQIRSLFENLESFLCNNFDYFCYFVMLIDHMINSSFLTILYPLSIFCYALLENPRPKKIYWQFCIYYTVFILCAKFFFQLKLFNKIFDSDKYEDFLDALDQYKGGINYFESGFGIDFFNYIVFDAIVLIILSLNRNVLISNGLWEKREEQIENIFTANERVEANKDRKIETQNDARELFKEFLVYKPEEDIEEEKEENKDEDENIKKENNIDNKNDKKIMEEEGKRKLKFNTRKFEPKYDEGNRKFFQKLFPKIRNEKPGSDYYPYYTIILALIIIYILFFFTKMDQDKTYGPVNLDTTQFSGSMVLFLLLHVVILVYDRAIYISQNKNHLKYKYFIYKKDEKGLGNLLSKEEYKNLKNHLKSEFGDDDKKSFFIPPSGFEKLKLDNYNLFYVQTELFNKPLLHKYILHIFSTFVCHTFVFIYFPMQGNFNLVNTIYCIEGESCNDFSYNGYTVFFYLLYLVYLYLSSKQIRLGYFDIKRKSLFKRNTTVTNTISKIFNAIPFLPNIRNTVDWTFTSTCLDLFQWNKFESIYDTIFDTYCDSEGNDEEKIGQKVGKKKKIIMGGLLSFALIFILVIPLVLFSSLNPTNKLNNLTGAKLNVDLTFIYESGVVLNYNLFENERAKTIRDMSKSGDTWSRNNYDESVQTRHFKKSQIQVVKFSEYSDRNWDLAGPHIKELIDLLNINNEDNEISKIYLNIGAQFERPLPAESQTVSHSFSLPVLDISKDKEGSEGMNKTLQLKDALENCEEVKLEFEEAYTSPLRLTAGDDISEIEDEKYILMKNVQLGFQGCQIEKDSTLNISSNSYSKSYFTFRSKKITKSENESDIWEGLEFHVFNDKISETTSGYSVLTFYLTFILVAGAYVQEFLASEPEKIMFTELPHPESIVNLCEGIKISRYSYDFKKEEYLFTILIELMRSPDYLKLLTQSSIDHFKVREQNTYADDDNEEDGEDKNDEDSSSSDEDDNNKKKEENNISDDNIKNIDEDDKNEDEKQDKKEDDKNERNDKNNDEDENNIENLK